MPVDNVSATVGGEEGNATSAYQIWNAVRVLYYTLYHSILYHSILYHSILYTIYTTTILGNMFPAHVTVNVNFYVHIWFVCSYCRRVLHAAKRMLLSGRIHRNLV